MAKRSVFAGNTSNREYIVIRDVNGSPITGLVFNSTGLIAYYVLPGAASVQITLATQTVTGAYSSGGFVEIDATHMPGLYRFDVPDAVFAAGNHKSVVCLSGFAGMAALYLEYDLWAVNPQDAVRFAMTALPNANAGATGGIGLAVVRAGTAQAGTSTTLTLDAGASAVDDYYKGQGIRWTSGANSGVTRIVTSYVGSTKVATFAVALPTTADATPTFEVTPIRHLLPGADGKGLVSTDTQDLSASLSVNTKTINGTTQTARDLGASVLLSSGTGTGQLSLSSGTVTVGTNNDKTGYSLSAGQLFLKKNVAFTLTFPMTDSTTHAPKTGLTVASQRSIDGAALAGTSASVAELSAGLYTLAIAGSDVNGTQITFVFSAPGADTRFITVVTQA